MPSKSSTETVIQNFYIILYIFLFYHADEVEYF